MENNGSDVEIELAYEQWMLFWKVSDHDVVCRECQRKQRLISADEPFGHRASCRSPSATLTKYPWQALALSLQPCTRRAANEPRYLD
ncbi:hypothetical protein [Pseudomonas savastanoi]|uniref:Uncharacterized protein n=1 Tax=Pseudomonas savastanoi TaxID=29438 RepID=A0A3M5G683_PSESS|nr:hypothetical protein [Pseudomonas savastanoi]RMS82182.1 hypothetical protein ALP59_00648 [Pseudomonas savastanoi]